MALVDVDAVMLVEGFSKTRVATALDTSWRVHAYAISTHVSFLALVDIYTKLPVLRPDVAVAATAAVAPRCVLAHAASEANLVVLVTFVDVNTSATAG